MNSRMIQMEKRIFDHIDQQFENLAKQNNLRFVNKQTEIKFQEVSQITTEDQQVIQIMTQIVSDTFEQLTKAIISNDTKKILMCFDSLNKMTDASLKLNDPQKLIIKQITETLQNNIENTKGIDLPILILKLFEEELEQIKINANKFQLQMSQKLEAIVAEKSKPELEKINAALHPLTQDKHFEPMVLSMNHDPLFATNSVLTDLDNFKAQEQQKTLNDLPSFSLNNQDFDDNDLVI